MRDDEIMRQLPGAWAKGEEGGGAGRGDGGRTGGGGPEYAMTVLREVRMVSLVKGKAHHEANMHRFMEIDKQIAAGTVRYEDVEDELADIARGMCRQILVPSAHCRTGQRLDIVRNQKALLEGLVGIEFSALVKGGAACQTTMMRAAWGAGMVIFGTDISNGFPSIKRAYVREALEEVCPALLPMFDACYGRDIEIHGRDASDVIFMPEGVAQGDSLSTG